MRRHAECAAEFSVTPALESNFEAEVDSYNAARTRVINAVPAASLLLSHASRNLVLVFSDKLTAAFERSKATAAAERRPHSWQEMGKALVEPISDLIGSLTKSARADLGIEQIR
jgi:hypothetical protein